jgi:hypothetical protein
LRGIAEGAQANVLAAAAGDRHHVGNRPADSRSPDAGARRGSAQATGVVVAAVR